MSHCPGVDRHPCASDNRRRLGQDEGAVKLGYFHNGHFPPIDFEEFVRWGAANGYQAIDVPLFQPDARAICESHGLEPTSTTGMACQPIATDAAARTEAVAEARRALDYAAAEDIPIAWLGHQMAPDLGSTPTCACSRTVWRRCWITRSGSASVW